MPTAFHVFFDHELPSGRVVEICATLSADGDVLAFDVWGPSGRWVPLPDDLGLDMDDLRERAKEAATAAARNWP